MAYSLTYSYDSASQSYSVTGYSNITTSGKVVIPATYNDGTNGEHSVTSVGNGAFRDCSSLTNITIGNSVNSIGEWAFYNCSSLTSITIPNSVTNIGNHAFRNCSSLTSITIPNSVTNIGEWEFYNCSSLTSVTIPNSVTSIGHSAFRSCSNLTSVTIGNSVTSIDDYAFIGCSSLKQLILLPSTPPTLGSSAIPSTISKIYVPKSSKAAYQAATNWTKFASKIVSDNIYLSFVRFNQKNKEYIDKKINDNWNDFNLENGEGVGSLAQKRLKSDGVTWTTAKAYQGASTAFGGGTQAGRTKDEFNTYFWDSTKNVALNGGKGKDSNGNILDNNGLTYAKSYSYALAEGESTKALGRSSHSEGNATQSIGDHSHSEGLSTKAEGYAAHTEGTYTEAYYTGSHAEGNHTKTYAPYQHVGGTYNHYNINALYQVGNGTSDNDRKNAFEVLKDGRAKIQTTPKDTNDVANKGYVDDADSALDTSINNEKTAREDAINALIGSGIQGTGNPPLQGYNRDNGTIEKRLKDAEQTTDDFNRSYRTGFSHHTSNIIEIVRENLRGYFFVMIAILDRSNNRHRHLTCCMTIGEGKPSTGYFITGVGTSSGITFLQSETISCTYSESNKTYTLTGPSEEVSGGGYKYELTGAAVLEIR